MKSPLAIVYAVATASAMLVFAIQGWIGVKKNWALAKQHEAKATREAAEARSQVSQAELDEMEVQLKTVAYGFVLQHLADSDYEEIQKLPENHPSREIISRSQGVDKTG